MAKCLLALGSNLGDRQARLSGACREIARIPGTKILAKSRWHQTAPIGGPSGQQPFYNGAVLLQTSLEPCDLAKAIRTIETRLGRHRDVRWDARAIDIDLLLYDRRVISTSDLSVPHPRMSFRKFVLEPAAEIAGHILHPTSGWILSRLLTHLCLAPRYVAITSVESQTADWLASEISQAFEGFRLESLLDDSLAASSSAPLEGVQFALRAEAVLRESIWRSHPTLSPRHPATWVDQGVGQAPVISGFWLDAVAALHIKKESFQAEVRPALVIALVGQDKQFSRVLQHCAAGPLAKITTNQPDTILQESLAAVRSVWPELQTTPLA